MKHINYDIIDDYLLGNLTDKALENFEDRLQKEPGFVILVEEQRQAMALLNEMGDRTMRLELQEAQQKYIEQKTKQPKNRKPWLIPLLLALLLLLIGVIWWALKKTDKTNLYQNYYAAYETSYADRNSNDEIKIKLAEASQEYLNKKFDKALPIFNSVPDEFQDGRLQLMTGICHLELGNHQQALQFFLPLFENKDPVFQYHGLWYASMTYIKTGTFEKAKELLTQLSNAQSPNGVFKQKESKEILKKL